MTAYAGRNKKLGEDWLCATLFCIARHLTLIFFFLGSCCALQRSVTDAPIFPVFDALGWGEGVDDATDNTQMPSKLCSAAVRSAAFSLAKACVWGSAPNRVEVRAIGRAIEQVGACGLDGGPDAGALVAAKVVHDDDVVRAELGHQHLLDIVLTSKVLIGPSSTIVATMPMLRRPAAQVVVSQ